MSRVAHVRMLHLHSNKFTFDRVFGMDSTQVEVYEFAARPVVEEALKVGPPSSGAHTWW